MRAAALALLFLVTGAVGSQAAEKASDKAPVIREGTLYATARGTLMTKGFQPVPSSDRDDSRCSAGRQDVCAAYPETVSCSGTGAAACRFIFSSKTGKSMTLVAEGRDAARLKVVTSRLSAKRDADWQRSGR